MSTALDVVAGRIDPVGLDELNARAGLQTRVDSKYLIDLTQWDALVDRLQGQVQILQIEDRQEQTYDTIYFDTPQLRCYHDHLQRRRFAFKLRSRRYLGSDLHVFEVKMRDGRRNTIKFKTDHSDTAPDVIGPTATHFYEQLIRQRYGLWVTDQFVASLRNRYTRITLASVRGKERTTVDHSLTFSAPTSGTGTGTGGMRQDLVLIETKSAQGNGSVDRMLWDLGVRPHRVSKFVVGITHVHRSRFPNRYAATLARGFDLQPPAVQTAVLGAPAPDVPTDDLPRPPRPPRAVRPPRPPRPPR